MPPEANLDVSVAIVKGALGLGTHSTDCLRKWAFKSSKAFWQVGVHSQGWSFLVRLMRGQATEEYSGIKHR